VSVLLVIKALTREQCATILSDAARVDCILRLVMSADPALTRAGAMNALVEEAVHGLGKGNLPLASGRPVLSRSRSSLSFKGLHLWVPPIETSSSK
jgi:hypothetical protein